MSELLRLDGVRKSFGDHVVLSDVDLTVEPGQCVVLIGASGSAKRSAKPSCSSTSVKLSAFP